MSSWVCSATFSGNETWVFSAIAMVQCFCHSHGLLARTLENAWVPPYLSDDDCSFLSPSWALKFGISVVWHHKWRHERRQPVGYDYSFLLQFRIQTINSLAQFRRFFFKHFHHVKRSEVLGLLDIGLLGGLATGATGVFVTRKDPGLLHISPSRIAIFWLHSGP